MHAVVVLLLASHAAAVSFDASHYSDLARTVSPTVTCMAARCMVSLSMPVMRDWEAGPVTFHLLFTAEFENYDMAMHFRGTSNGSRIIDVDISGETPSLHCHKVDEEAYPVLIVCIAFTDINSIGNSLQVCARVGGGIINNPPNVLSNLGCFTADTQTISMAHSIAARARAEDDP